MRLELACYDKNATFDDLTKTVFMAESKRFAGISVTPYYVNMAKELSPKAKIGTVIDYPHGMELPQIRLASILQNEKHGIKYVDLVINHGMLLNDHNQQFINDLDACAILCKQKKLEFGIMIDYQLLDTKVVLELGHLLKQREVNHLVTSTLTISDDIENNIIIAGLLQQKTELPVIIGVQTMSDKYYEICKKNKIYGIRFGSYRNRWLNDTKFGVLKRG